jgi:hypothetical protein
MARSGGFRTNASIPGEWHSVRDCKRSILAAMVFSVLAWPMVASADYIEAVNGDLSGDFAHPTPIAVAIGSTTVAGTVEGKGKGVSVDLDYFKVTIPEGQVLAALIVDSGTQGGGAIGAFIALFDGATAVDPGSAAASDTLGFYLYGAGDVGSNILEKMQGFTFGGSTSPGFDLPLPAGDYTFWVQEGFLGTFPSNFQIVVQSAPAPPTILLLGLVGLALGVRHYRRASRRGRSREGKRAGA